MQNLSLLGTEEKAEARETRTGPVRVEKTMQEIYNRIGLDHHTYVTTINQQGVKIL